MHGNCGKHDINKNAEVSGTCENAFKKIKNKGGINSTDFFKEISNEPEIHPNDE